MKYILLYESDYHGTWTYDLFDDEDTLLERITEIERQHVSYNIFIGDEVTFEWFCG